MINPFRKGILFGSTVSITLTAIFVSAMFIVAVAINTAEDTRLEFSKHMEALLDTVENTASIACFVGDQQLATEVVSGLLKSHEVARVVIRSGDKELARGDRAGLFYQNPQIINGIARKISSPFNKGEFIGEIKVESDANEINTLVREKVYFTILMLVLQLFFVVFAVVLIVYYVVVRPIRSLSSNLHSIDAAAGEKLLAPVGHEGNEIASLISDINKLSDTLVSALVVEQELRIQREIDAQKYHSIFDNAGSGIFISDDEGHISSFNRSFVKLTYFPIEEHSQSPKLEHVRWCDYEKLIKIIELCISTGDNQSAELKLDTDELCWLNVTVTAIGDKQVQGVISDVSQVKQSEETALQRVIMDDLTGLPNRSGLERYLPEVMRNGHAEPFALMLVDVRGFKKINGDMGMAAGDLMLKVAGSRLKGCLKSTDWIGRLGGDEFAIVLHGVSTRAAADSVATRMAGVFRKPIEINDNLISPGCDIGIAFYPVDGDELASLMRSAEFALTYAKIEEGHDFQFYTPDMVVTAEQHRKLETELHQSISRNELRLFYQPIVDLKAGCIVGAEALIRWQHPTRGLVPPDMFIPVAEESNFICDMGLWVLETACQQLATWQAAGQTRYLSINVSARQIPDALPPDLIMAMLKRYGVPVSLLALEITEGVLLSDVEKGVKWLKELRNAGFRVYMDDFGTGYSSLSYLKRFPIDVVKVDKSFINDMNAENNDRVLVQAIIAMSQALGLQVVAEGIENECQFALLREMNCHYGQGYYFSKPIPAHEFDLLVVEGLHVPLLT
jgi:diguanylate cyclase (GGDEF)-like protein/PAS domain S-box-containing protein